MAATLNVRAEAGKHVVRTLTPKRREPTASFDFICSTVQLTDTATEEKQTEARHRGHSPGRTKRS